MNFLEKNLESIIFETPIQTLQQKGLEFFSGLKRRQFNLGGQGIVDLLTVHRYHEEEVILFTIYELKRNIIDSDALVQILRYKLVLEDYLFTRNIDFAVSLVLIGTHIKQNVLLASAAIKNLRLYTYSFSIDGLTFKEV